MNVSSNRKEGIFNSRGLISNTLLLKKVLYTHVQSRAGQQSGCDYTYKDASIYAEHMHAR